MRRTRIRAGLLAGGTGFLLFASTDSWAHGFAGPRFFPATLATDDPFVADELALPTIASFKDESDIRTTTYSGDFAKRLTSNFGIEFGGTYVQMRPPGGPDVNGFDNFSIGAKYQLLVDPQRELIFAAGVDIDLGGTGATRIGAEDFTTFTPTFFFGKGFGDLADNSSFMRAFALTGSVGVGLPSKAKIPDGAGGFENIPHVLHTGLALEYSFPYLQSQVRNVGLTAPFDRLIPLVELSLETPLDRGGGKTVGTLNPGFLWSGQQIQLGLEAIIPLNRDSGHNVGFLMQLHFYLDDILPGSLGRPLFGG
jgi:hypothetical protein